MDNTCTFWPNLNQRVYNSWFIFPGVNHFGFTLPTTYGVVFLVKLNFLLGNYYAYIVLLDRKLEMFIHYLEVLF